MINALFAVDHYGGMGFNGTMPWPKNSADLKNFQDLTMGHVVVMGRTTWEDKNMPKPLKGRTTYVATNLPYMAHTAIIKGDLKERLVELEKQHPDKIIWVVGGPDVLEQCSGIFDKLYLTHYKGSFKIDTRIDLKKFLLGWEPKSAIADAKQNFTTVIYESLFKRLEGRS
jgi:dihydrofolate reductase